MQVTTFWFNDGLIGILNSSAFNKNLCLVDSDVIIGPPLSKPQNVT